MRIVIIYKKEDKDRWFKGDRYLRRVLRSLFRRGKASGLDMVFKNLKKGLKRIGLKVAHNPSLRHVKADEIVVVLGVGRYSLRDYNINNPIIAGIGLMTHPAEWPDLCINYPVQRYLQHSEWANNLYIPYYGPEICKDTWAVGIDTQYWKPIIPINKRKKVLIYNKFRWNQSEMEEKLMWPVIKTLESYGFQVEIIRYGNYKISDFRRKLRDSKFMVFFCEHESQGIAYQEALSCDVPILAWDNGRLKDPNYKKWDDYECPASSVPFWSIDCGDKFDSYLGFQQKIVNFINQLDSFKPRKFIEDTLSIEKSAMRFMEIYLQVQKELLQK